MSRITRNIIALTFAVVTALPLSQPAPVAAANTCATSHTVAQGETLYRIARKYGTTLEALKALNNLRDINRINAGQVLCVREQVQSSIKHTVARGDTLASIARKYGVNMNVLAQVNNITNVNRIFVGQVLTIPEVTIQ
jgi:LysM repeat protein